MAGQFRRLEIRFQRSGFRAAAILRAPSPRATACASRRLSSHLRLTPGIGHGSHVTAAGATEQARDGAAYLRINPSGYARGTAVRLVLCDVESLVERDGTLASATIAAVARLAKGGLPLTIISRRSPFDIRSVARNLGLDIPIAAFSGGTILRPDGPILSAHPLPAPVSRAVLKLLDASGVTVWVYAQDRWFTNNSNNPRNRRERHASHAEPIVLGHFDGLRGRIDKIVAVSDDPAHLHQLEDSIRQRLGARVTVSRPQDCYCDITHPIANKAAGMMMLAEAIGVSLAQTTVIGSSQADIPMMVRAGFSIALDAAPGDVTAAATWVVKTETSGMIAPALNGLLSALGRDARCNAHRRLDVSLPSGCIGSGQWR